MSAPQIPLVPGKWYGGKTGKPRYLLNMQGGEREYLTDIDGKLKSCWCTTWDRWATSGPHDTREQAEQARGQGK